MKTSDIKDLVGPESNKMLACLELIRSISATTSVSSTVFTYVHIESSSLGLIWCGWASYSQCVTSCGWCPVIFRHMSPLLTFST